MREGASGERVAAAQVLLEEGVIAVVPAQGAAMLQLI
jgi:hypothetical protein